MTKEERQQSLINARLACKWFRRVADELPPGQARSEVECLIAEFERLDAGEQARNAAGRTHGHKGGEFGHLGKEHGNKPPAPGKKRGRPRNGA